MTGLSQITLKGYTIIKKLGEGGFGTTYLVKSVSNQTHYALKHFTFPSYDPDTYIVAQRLFRREVEILQTLNGTPQIPRFIDYWKEKQEHFLVEEFIPGKLLREELEQGKKTEAYIIELLTEILAILRFIHSKRIIHRDINPSNIIRSNSDKKLVLIDFGAVAIQKIFTTAISTQIQTPTRIYTLGYAPVEQTQGNPQFNSDIYALGMTAIQMLTGIEPQNLQTDINGEIIWCDQAEVSDRTTNIINNMVRYDHTNRYDSVERVLKELSKTSSSNSPTKVLNISNNLNSSQAELGRNQVMMILICLLAFLSVIKILSAAGVLPESSNIDININTNLKNQPSKSLNR